MKDIVLSFGEKENKKINDNIVITDEINDELISPGHNNNNNKFVFGEHGQCSIVLFVTAVITVTTIMH